MIRHHGNPAGELFYDAPEVEIETLFFPPDLNRFRDIPYVFYVSRNAVPVRLTGTCIRNPLGSVLFYLILFAVQPARHNAAEFAGCFFVMQRSVTFFPKTVRPGGKDAAGFIDIEQLKGIPGDDIDAVRRLVGNILI